MNSNKKHLKLLITMVLVLSMTLLPVCAADKMLSTYSNISPRFNNISGAYITIGFRMNDMIYCSVDVDPYTNCSGISGIMKLFDSNGNCLEVWSVSDYERPIFHEFSFQGVFG